MNVDYLRVAVLFGLGACLPTLVAFFARLSWIAELATHFRVQYLVMLAPVIALFAWKRRKLVAIPAVCFAINLIYVVPLYFGRDAAGGEQRAKLLAVNVHTSNTEHQLLLDLVKREDPDILITIETDERWIKSLRAIEERYPHFAKNARSDNFGLAIYSKIPVNVIETKYFTGDGVPFAILSCTLGQAKITVLGAHPLPPVSQGAAAERDSYLEGLAKISRALLASGHHVVIAGDLNVTPWAPAFSKLLEESGLENGRLGFGVLPSWPTSPFYLWIPIDHVLVSEKIRVRDLRILESAASDHYPILAELEF